MQTLPSYDDYVRGNLAPFRKALDKRPVTNGMSSEGEHDRFTRRA